MAEVSLLITEIAVSSQALLPPNFCPALDFPSTITSSIISGIHNSYFRRLNGTENQVKNSAAGLTRR